MSKEKQPKRVLNEIERGRRRIKRLALWSAGIFCVATCILAWPYVPSYNKVYTDSDSINTPQAHAKIREILWTPPNQLRDLLGEDEQYYEPRVSQDGTTLYFVKGKAGENADIFFARKTIDGWGEPQPLVEINSEYDELGPAPTADGKAIYFYSDRPGGEGGYDLWVARQSIDGRSTFTQPVNLGPSVNSPFSDYGPALTPDGKRIYFSTNRPPSDEAEVIDPDAWSATIREDLHRRTYDVYSSQISEAGMSEALPVDAINSEANEGAPAISPVGDFLYIASDRNGSIGGFDLYRARLIDGIAQDLESLGQTVNTPNNELDPALDMGGFGLYFSSDRVAESTESTTQRYGLYHTTSREVYSDLEMTRAQFDWAGFWDDVGLALLLALLALALILLLLYLMQGVRGQPLSLLARCLLASMLVHLLILFLLALWEVSAGLANAAKGKGKVHITLASSNSGGNLVQQVRGNLTQIESPETVQTESQYKPAQVEIRSAFEPVQLDKPQRAVVLTTNSIVSHKLEQPTATKSYELPELTLPMAIAQNDAAMEMSLPRESVQQQSEEPQQNPAESVAQVEATRMNATPSTLLDTSAAMATVQIDPTASGVPELSSSSLMASASQLPTEVDPSTTDSPIPNSFAEDAFELTDAPAATIENLPTTSTAASAAEPSVNPVAAAASSGAPQRSESTDAFAAPPLDNESVEFDVDSTEFATTEMMAEIQTPEISNHNAQDSTQPSDISESALAISQPAANELELPTMKEVSPVAAQESENTNPPTPSSSLTLADSLDTPEPSRIAPDLLAKAVNEIPTLESELPTSQFEFDSDTFAMLDAPETALPDIQDMMFEDVEGTQADDSSNLDLSTNLLPSKARSEEYAHRSAQERAERVEQGGGSEQTEQAVADALDWLARHQSPNGSWSGNEFDNSCGYCGGQTDAVVDIGLTGLATLCFLAADHTHDMPGPYQQTVAKALHFLKEQQNEDGDLRGRETMYSHAISAIALAESYGMSGDEEFEETVQDAINFIEYARNKREGGWRYDPRQPGDTSVLGWQVMAIKAAGTAGLDIPWKSLNGARQWLDNVSGGSSGGKYAYMPGREYSPSMTAEALFVRYLLGNATNSRQTRESVKFILDNPPRWTNDPNTYYWYYATLALFQHGGEPWQVWNKQVTRTLLENQRQDNKAKGSWDPIGRWAEVGGRVYQTAICTLTLEVYYRYLPSFAKPIPEDAIGRIVGQVTEVESGAPLANASIRLDLPDREPQIVQTDSAGRYELFPPPLPDFFAVSASREGFLPESENVARALVADSTLELDFALEPMSEHTIAIEADPRVHHLGDNDFDGTINSQFQREAEGDTYIAKFSLDGKLLNSGNFNRAEITMLAKGVQMQHKLIVNGHLLRDRLESSPANGSFGEFIADFDASYLRAGENKFELHASARGTDIDDFEFVNIKLRLKR